MSNASRAIAWRWRVYIFLVAALLALPILALIARGGDAVQAITRDGQGTAVADKRALAPLPPCDPAGCVVPSGGVANFGVYDPDGWFKDSKNVAVEHVYVRWNGLDHATLSTSLEDVVARGRWPLVTVEPWPASPDRAGSLLSDVAAGAYDDAIDEICTTVASLDHPAFLRWGHEMELDTGRYPWSTREANDYIYAYRHIVGRCRLSSTQIYYVWAPAGNEDANWYWPGADYVDYVGLSVFGFPEWDQKMFGRVRGFEENFSEKYWRVAWAERPVMIAELGVTGDQAYQGAWIREAQASLARYPLVRTIVYFNSGDAEAVWGPELRTPDWRIDPRLFD